MKQEPQSSNTNKLSNPTKMTTEEQKTTIVNIVANFQDDSVDEMFAKTEQLGSACNEAR